MIATGIGDPGNLIHFQYTLQESGFTGLTRVYSNMTDLVTAGLAASFAAVMLSRNRTVRLVALPMVVLLTTSTIVQLTRARWVGLVVGIVVVTCWLTIINGQTSVATLLRKRLALVVGILGLATILILTTAPDILSGGTTIHRFSSLFTDLQTGGGTVAVREAATKTMKAYLGGGWLSGLGFIPPSRHYFESLPHGSIRDADLGVLNAVMTMGVIGAVLIYLPVIWMLTDCLRRRSLQQAAEYDWLRYGGAIWIVATLVSSITLVTLFSTSGLVLVSVRGDDPGTPECLGTFGAAQGGVRSTRAQAVIVATARRPADGVELTLPTRLILALRAASGNHRMMRPTKDTLDFLVIGAQKAGTTSLFEYLRRHPEIYLPTIKEAPYFSQDAVRRRGWEAYFGEDIPVRRSGPAMGNRDDTLYVRRRLRRRGCTRSV